MTALPPDSDPVARYERVPPESETRPARPGTKHLYVVVCERGRYYVGVTRRPVHERMAEHFEADSQGAVWTATFEPETFVLVARDVPAYADAERRLTLRLMVRHGYETVRGGPYTRSDLPKPRPLRDDPPYDFLLNDDSARNERADSEQSVGTATPATELLPSSL